jgi:nitrilase
LGEPDAGVLALLEAMPGQDADLILRGGSAIIAPDTSYIRGPILDEPSILCAEIQPERLSEGHLTLDTAGHYSRPDVFHLTVNDRPQEQVSFAAQGEKSP